MPTFPAVLLGLAVLSTPMASFLEQHDMVWEVPPQRWLEGIPLANGHIGAMVWGDGSTLKITLDRYDAWETRERILGEGDITYAKLRRMVAEGRRKEVEESLFTSLRQGPRPTRLPMPRIEIGFGPSVRWQEARLSLSRATATIGLLVHGKPLKLSLLTHARQNLLWIRMSGDRAGSATVRVRMDHLDSRATRTLKDMGYPDPVVASEAAGGTLHAKTPAGYEYAVAWRRCAAEPSGQCIAVSLLSNQDAEDPLRAARALAEEACRAGGAQASHESWWEDYWKRSFLTVPDAHLEALYYIEMYKLGASTRPGGYPITLQGLWTSDGGMPPWAGDYHLDMNVQQTYWPIYTSNRLELGEPLYRTFFECLPRWQRQCRQFFGFEGIWSGCAIGPRGERVWGYTGAELWPGNAAWLAHHYWLHFLYSQDRQFLRDRAFPFLRLAFLTYANLLEPGPDGRLHIPLSHSPEWGEGSMDALVMDPACDVALIRFLGGAILESTRILGLEDSLTGRVKSVLEGLIDYPRANGSLLISAGKPLTSSHRHHSHLMAIHPLGLLTAEGSEAERLLIQESIAEIRNHGTGAWTGWSFPWMSLIASRAGNGNMAWLMLDLYANLFIKPNTLHVNGDPRMFGLSRFTYEPTTLEAGFGAAAAVMEMLLQSHHGRIRLFPTIPDRWHDAFFSDLRAEGAFLVTARLERGKVRFALITSEAGGPCEVWNPFGGPAVLEELDGKGKYDTRLEGRILRFSTERGRRYLLYPDGRRPNNGEMSRPLPVRTDRERHFYGLKRLARF
ncbi:MAG: glycoside hydrolase N-terminal domain-containing protein [Acidobacteria bacterium]|nr:glycoside hydrolase N-terminal domain-containing protein [Acidobacteriota bacterium]